SISVDRKANGNFYKKKGVMASEIINGTVTSDDETSRRFLASVTSSTNASSTMGVSHTASAAPSSTGDTSASGSATPVGPAAGPHSPPSGARTFPMEDPTPGQEPK